MARVVIVTPPLAGHPLAVVAVAEALARTAHVPVWRRALRALRGKTPRPSTLAYMPAAQVAVTELVDRGFIDPHRPNQ